MKLRSMILGLMVLPLALACEKKKEETSSDPSTSDPFTVTAISKTWTSNCEAGSEPITGDDHYKVSLTLNSDGTFHSDIFWYTGSTCLTGNNHAIYGLYGIYSLGSYLSGSTDTKTLDFTIDLVNYNGSDLMTMGNATRAAYNTKCGGTSPFTGGANATDGGHVDTSHMLCTGETFPNSGVNKVFSNIASFDGTNLTLGAFDQANIPGAFPGGTVANATTIPLH